MMPSNSYLAEPPEAPECGCGAQLDELWGEQLCPACTWAECDVCGRDGEAGDFYCGSAGTDRETLCQACLAEREGVR